MYDRDTLSRLEAPDIMSEMDTSWEPRWNGIGVEGEDEEGEELRRLDEEEEAGKRKLGMRKVRGSLFAQFAANDGTQLADAVELVKPWVDGIDINCGASFLPPLPTSFFSVQTHLVWISLNSGCPQKWAYHEGIGSALLRQPDLVRDLIRTTKQRVGWEFPVSVKIRVDSDLKCVHTNFSHPAQSLTLCCPPQTNPQIDYHSHRCRSRHPDDPWSDTTAVFNFAPS